MTRIRWRLNEPLEAHSHRWSRVHLLRERRDERALCGVLVPDHPYMADLDEWIPDDAPACSTCRKRDGVPR